MRFQKGIYYPHPPRGRARKPYRMSEAALAQRRRNLSRVKRLRSRDESLVIKLLIRQSNESQRKLAMRLGVRASYVCKVRRMAQREGTDALSERRVTWDDLARARCTTANLREKEPRLFSRKEQRESVSAPAWISPEQQAEERRRADVNSALERLEKRREAEGIEKSRQDRFRI